ncbi:MAG: ABC transporter permease subunit [candidate division Zixibacteria bacterium]|nr:ABC transporter permease subunit [candidate division Zixibacteria bacterium]
MKNAFVLAVKDMASYFHSWVGVLVFVSFFLIAGVFFSFLVLSYARISFEAARNAYEGIEGLGLTRFVFSSFFLNLGSILIFLMPLITMRSFAEERRSQTLELLYTYPFSDFEIVWGKFLGMVWFFEILVLPTAGYILVLRWLGAQIDWGPILIGYLGFWLLGNAYISLGLFVSTLSESQVVSAIVTFSCLTVFWMLDWVTGLADGRWAHLIAALSPLGHYREFSLGILDLSNVVYFCFFHFFFLFLALRSIESRNWKG